MRHTTPPAVVLARFLPIVRTFAPFVAGVSSMDYSKFVWYNVLGATIWTVLFIGVGFCFGTLPVIQNNFSLAVLGIIGVSVLGGASVIYRCLRRCDLPKRLPGPLQLLSSRVCSAINCNRWGGAGGCWQIVAARMEPGAPAAESS
jgi:hypothetical protein